MKAIILLISLTTIFCTSPLLKVENGQSLSEYELLELFEDSTEIENYFSQAHFETFKKNVEKIIEHNSNPRKTYTQGVNKFTFMTDEEFEGFYLGASQNCSATKKSNIQFKKFAPPSYWDWRNVSNVSYVSPVKNQGKCGSCWTFSTTGAIESHYSLLRNVTPPNLSEQQLVDCAQAFDNFGCRGGLPSHAFEYIKYNGGLEFESNYTYQAKDGVCKFNSSLPNIKVNSGAVNITMGDEVELRDALFEFGPISITYQVVSDFRNYKSGIYESTVCRNGTMDVNHAVLAVGYGRLNGTDYWIVKNSWGAEWGDQGYFKIKRGVNMCGVAVCNSFPNLNSTHHHNHFTTSSSGFLKYIQ